MKIKKNVHFEYIKRIYVKNLILCFDFIVFRIFFFSFLENFNVLLVKNLLLIQFYHTKQIIVYEQVCLKFANIYIYNMAYLYLEQYQLNTEFL